MIKYKIIKKDNIDELEHDVNSHLKVGYKLAGDLIIISHQNYFQAFQPILFEEEDYE